MKKKLLSLVLILVMLPVALLFTGCKSNYDLSALEQDYKNIYSSCETIKLDENNTIVIDYSNYDYFNNQVEMSQQIYGHVKKYNEMLTNMMAFATKYVSPISKGEFEIDKNDGKQLKNQLEELETSLKNLDVAMKDTAYYVQLVQDPSNQHCLVKLNYLFNCYNAAYEDAFNFNSTLMEIYFSSVQTKDYTKVNDFSVIEAIYTSKFEARLIQQIVFTTQVYVEINIDDQQFSQTISIDKADNFGGKQTEYNTYTNTVNALKRTFTAATAENANENLEKKEAFKELTVKLNNIQQVMNNEISYYKNACNSVKYSEKFNNINADKFDKSNIQLISSFKLLNDSYNTTLNGMLDTLLK